jgi:coenzyme F420 hydrogenase subunit beta
MIHAQLGICGGCITAKAYEGIEEDVYYVQHSQASSENIKRKFGEKEVEVIGLEDLPEDRIGIVEGPICFQDKEEGIRILKTVREKTSELLGFGVCICGDGKSKGGFVSPICMESAEIFCRYARIRHIPASGIVDLDYAVPLCSPHPSGAKKIISAFVEGDREYLSPFAEMARAERVRTIQDVIEEGICTGCGTCATVCPTRCISLIYGKPAIEHSIDRSRCIRCGTCYMQCPRSFIDLKLLQKFVFGKEPDDALIGTYTGAYSARSKDEKILEKAQDGGIGTAILLYALEEGVIDGAVTAIKGERPWEPVPFVATNKEELLDSAGTKYTVASNMITLRKAIRGNGFRKLGYVGTPCNVQALRKMELYPIGAREIPESIEFIVGLFCMENFYYADVRSIVEFESGAELKKVKKMDIKKGKFWVHTVDGDVISIELEDAKKYASPPCKICLDYTAELADISIGSVGSPGGWSTVLVRTGRGEKIWEDAVEKMYIESVDLEEVKPGIGLVRRLARLKKEENMSNVKKMEDEGRTVPYLGI